MAGFFFFRRSLGQDDVDRYNNTYAVLLFLMLSLLSLLMPLSPTLNDSMKPRSAASAPSPSQQKELSLKVKAECWTPPDFNVAQVKYTNEYCADVANGLLNGVKSDRRLYELTDSADAMDELNLTSIDKSRKGYFENFSLEKDHQKKIDEATENARELIDFRTPVILFLLALFLKMPYILWSLLSNTMTSCINVDQTLDSCVESRNLDMASQKQIFEETAAAVADSVKKSRNTACLLYLFVKIFALVVVAGEAYFVSKYVVPDIRSMELDLSTMTLSSSNKATVKENTVEQLVMNITDAMQTDDEVGLFDYPNNILRCGFKIRQFKATQTHIVQCMFTILEQASTETVGTPITSMPSPVVPSSIKSTLLLYDALYSVVLAFLAILVIANTLNTVSWLLRLLVKTYATSMGLSSNAAKDVVLLVHMAWINVGPRVARGLSGSAVWSTGIEETNVEPMLETNA